VPTTPQKKKKSEKRQLPSECIFFETEYHYAAASNSHLSCLRLLSAGTIASKC
jgi:hypothetical protein